MLENSKSIEHKIGEIAHCLPVQADKRIGCSGQESGLVLPERIVARLKQSGIPMRIIGKLIRFHEKKPAAP